MLLLLAFVVIMGMNVQNNGRVGVDVDTVPCVEQRRSGCCGGVEELLGSTDSCCCCSRLGIRSGACQLSIRCQVCASIGYCTLICQSCLLAFN